MRPALFTPLELRGTTFRNRVVLSPMCQYAASDGHAGPWHVAHHGRFALAGLGGAILEATAVTPEGRITAQCLGLYDDAHVPGLSGIVDLYHAQGTCVGIQLSHSGRKGSAAVPWAGAGPLPAGDPEAWRTCGASALSPGASWPEPMELDLAAIDAIVEAFAAATRRARRAGFDFVEIHGAHGYLLHSFVSPLSNHRPDAFGGDRAGRFRLSLRVADAVRTIWDPNRPVFYRASAVDEFEGGISLQDTVALARDLKTAGIDVIDCSSGGIAGAVALGRDRPLPGFQVPFASAVRKDAGIATMAVGLITEPDQAEGVIASGAADLVALGRELLAHPNWMLDAALALGLEDPYSVLPISYGFFLERRARLLDPPPRLPSQRM